MAPLQLDKTYDPNAVESRWYQFWAERHYFHADPSHPGRPYSIVIPPPNVTGSLHVGHALNHSLQDILIRWRRMQGRNTLWLPGTDHAGIATQNVVEKQLLGEGISREALGRDRFVERVWQWKAASGNRIIEQQKQLGESCDWERLRFTMDEGLSRAVLEVFVRLYEDGLIYRGERLINWCPRCLTALSDIEVEHEDVKGSLYHIRYPLTDDPSTSLTVATTRPETMLGDPEVISAVASLPVSKARPKIEQALKDRALLSKVEDHRMALGKCYRCKTVVEPYLSPQWFIEIKPLAEPAIRAVEEGRIRIIPEGWINNYLGWMRDIKDWCISRQIWWGHQIPAWYCERCNEPFIHRQTSTNQAGDVVTRITLLQGAKPVVARSTPAKCPQCGGEQWLRDPDVLDTWFSSGLWPFSTLGWPEQTPALKTYYPTATLVTGLDILFFWVARMIMLGLRFMNDVPFRDVYIHALVRDAEGQKMSKSKGNVIDPLHVMDQFGTDALRFTLASMASPGRDLKLAEERIEGYRNFANKIWNAARFGLMYLDGARTAVRPSERPFPDRWILSRLNHTIQTVTSELEAYRFDRAASALYQFIWHEFCDWYVELIKPVLQNPSHADGPMTRQTLVETLEVTMRLLHPFMPFITEEIWQTIPHEGESIVIRPYPASEQTWDDPEIEEQFLLLEQTVGLVRTGRVLLNYPPGQAIEFSMTHDDPAKLRQLGHLQPHVSHLSRGTADMLSNGVSPVVRRLRLVAGGLSIALVISGDVDLKKALDRIVKQREQQEKEL